MGQQSVRILGIDPGSYHLGIGCIEKSGHSLRLLHAETLSAPRRLPLFERLDQIASRLHALLFELRPHEIAVENIFFAKSVKSALHLGTARGMAIGACLGRGLRIYEYAPTQVKMTVTGYGRADKAQVQKMVRLLVNAPAALLEEKLGFDASDAVAIAICHANSARLHLGA